MKEPVTQEYDYGCGIACFAFICGIKYKTATNILGKKQASSDRFWCKDLKEALNQNGKSYLLKHIKVNDRPQNYTEGSIVLLRRSVHYPFGHYLVRHNNMWMDPWINLAQDKNIDHAESGFRKRLPGKPMYLIFPIPGS